MMNVDQLDSAGNKVCAWCFVPEGKLSCGRLHAGAEDRAGDFRERGFGDRKSRQMIAAPAGLSKFAAIGRASSRGIWGSTGRL
jgi:hypothetical protein